MAHPRIELTRVTEALAVAKGACERFAALGDELKVKQYAAACRRLTVRRDRLERELRHYEERRRR